MSKVIAIIFTLLVAFNSHAGLIVTNEESQFEQATGEIVLADDYNDFAGFEILVGTRDRGVYSIIQESFTLAFSASNGVDSSGAFIMGFGSPYSMARFSVDDLISAFSFSIWAGYGFQQYEIIVGGDSIIIDVEGGYDNYQFFGFVSDSQFDEFTIRDLDGQGNGYFDNFKIASSVPEPTTLGLFGLALLAMRRLRGN